jgi:hypothetical protein
MGFNRIPEQKTAKSRIHFDLRAPGSVADEVARLTTLGATALRVGEDLTVMADPEGTSSASSSAAPQRRELTRLAHEDSTGSAPDHETRITAPAPRRVRARRHDNETSDPGPYSKGWRARGAGYCV